MQFEARLLELGFLRDQPGKGATSGGWWQSSLLLEPTPPRIWPASAKSGGNLPIQTSAGQSGAGAPGRSNARSGRGPGSRPGDAGECRTTEPAAWVTCTHITTAWGQALLSWPQQGRYGALPAPRLPREPARPPELVLLSHHLW